MKILYVTQHFPPETGAAQGRAYEMAKNLSCLDNEIIILTGFPNYPKGEIHDEYKGKFYQKEKIDNITVIRTFLIPDTKTNVFVRLLNYISFFISSIIGGMMQKNIDMIYASSPPLTVGISGYILSLLHKTDFILEIRDLWVESAVQLNELNNDFLISFGRRIEKFLYNKAKKIISVTNGIKESLIKEGIDTNKIGVITNGVDINHFKPVNKINLLEEELNSDDSFIVMYAGNIGTAQGLDVILDAALKTKEQNIKYYIIGEGVEKERLKRRINKKEISNVKLYDSKTKEEIVNYLSVSDALLVSLKNIPLFDGAIPSKLFDYMSMEKPILLGVNGEAKNILNDAEAGIYFEPENSDELHKAILKLYQNKKMRNRMGNNARKYIANNYTRKILAKKLDSILKNI